MEEKHRAELRKLARAIRAARQDAELSQEKLAELADVDRVYIGRIENGAVNVTWHTLSRIARALKLRPGALVARAGV